jgi:hypothetical protein
MRVNDFSEEFNGPVCYRVRDANFLASFKYHGRDISASNDNGLSNIFIAFRFVGPRPGAALENHWLKFASANKSMGLGACL